MKNLVEAPSLGELAGLLQTWKARGYVTADEIDALFAGGDPTPEQLDAVYVAIQKESIEIVEDEDDLIEPEPVEVVVPAVEDTSTADPVRMYLRSIGKVALLSG